MKELAVSAFVVISGGLAFATPVVENVKMSQGADKVVRVTYDLSGEDAIVTGDFLTNGVSIGGCHLSHMTGDVNKRVAVGSGKSFTWVPYSAWPEQNVARADVQAEVKAWSLQCPPDYMVVNLLIKGAVHYYPHVAAIPFDVTNSVAKSDYLVLRKIPAANVLWRMGSPTDELGRSGGATGTRETPREVALTNDYYIGIYEITQRQYELLMSGRPSYFNKTACYALRPVETLSYELLRGKATSGYDWPNNGHAVSSDGFIGKLRDHAGIGKFDLPTEAEWEFAARAGCGTALYNGENLESGDDVASDNLNPLGRYKRNGGFIDGTTVPDRGCTPEYATAIVGSYEPNAWGLYDMLGNVSEWCLDWFTETPTSDVVGPVSGEKRALRGGSWISSATGCRCAARTTGSPDQVDGSFGFRISCPAFLSE